VCECCTRSSVRNVRLTMNAVSKPRVVRRTYMLLGLCLVAFASFIVLDLLSVRRARHLRDDVCGLQLEQSTFSDVSQIFTHYGGWVVSHDNIATPCSPEGCTYLMTVENPITKAVGDPRLQNSLHSVGTRPFSGSTRRAASSLRSGCLVRTNFSPILL
jgi:hypothetical protein